MASPEVEARLLSLPSDGLHAILRKLASQDPLALSLAACACKTLDKIVAQNPSLWEIAFFGTTMLPGTSADLQTLREAVNGFGGFKKLVRFGAGLKKNAPETEPQDVCSLTQKDVQSFVFSRFADNCFAWSLGSCAFAMYISNGPQLLLNAQAETIPHSACGAASQSDSIKQEQIAPFEVYVVKKGNMSSAFLVNIKVAETLPDELANRPASMMLTLKSANRSFVDHLRNIGQAAYSFLVRIAGGASGQREGDEDPSMPFKMFMMITLFIRPIKPSVMVVGVRSWSSDS